MKQKLLCLSGERVFHLLKRMDDYADWMCKEGAYFKKELMLYHFTEEMSDENVGLLNAGRAIGGDDQGNIRDLDQGAPVIPG